MDTIPVLKVREIEAKDVGPIVNYWLSASSEYLRGMGADQSKLPNQVNFVQMLEKQLVLPYAEKPNYALIWTVDDEAIGHCNVNKIQFAKEAFMHLHIWNPKFRGQGLGNKLVSSSLSYFFQNLELNVLYSEPYSLNSAPHKTLEKVGFKFVKEYTTTPGYINFEQKVKRWKLSREQAVSLNVF